MIFVYNTTTTCNGSLGLSQVMDTTYDSKSYCNLLFDTMVRLSLPAIKQILLSSGAVTDQQEKDLLRKIEQSAMRLLLTFNNHDAIPYFSRYDHTNKGELTIKEWFNVLRIQNHVDTSFDMVRFLCLFVCKKFDIVLGFKCL